MNIIFYIGEKVATAALYAAVTTMQQPSVETPHQYSSDKFVKRITKQTKKLFKKLRHKSGIVSPPRNKTSRESRMRVSSKKKRNLRKKAKNKLPKASPQSPIKWDVVLHTEEEISELATTINSDTSTSSASINNDDTDVTMHDQPQPNTDDDDTAQNSKIMQLQRELELLRKQMEMINQPPKNISNNNSCDNELTRVLPQHPMPRKIASPNKSQNTTSTTNSAISNTTIAAPATKMAPPPPPLPSTILSSAPKKLVIKRTGIMKPLAKTASLTTILNKEVLNTARLKPVSKSPGGTPIKRKPLKRAASSAVDLISEALKSKFKNAKKADKENCFSDDEDWETSSSPIKTPITSGLKVLNK